MKLSTGGAWLVLGVCVALLAGCSKPPVAEIRPKPVRVVKVSPGGTALLAERTYSGELRSRIETTLGFQVAGKIIERRVNVGDHVHAGQVLARLDPTDTRLTVDQAEAQRALAYAEAVRYRELRAQRFVSQGALDDKENKLKAAEAQAALARNQNAYTTLLAAKSGVIGLVMADIGQVVTPGQGVFRMAPDGDREIALSIPEAEYAQFRVGMKAEVKLFALPEQRFIGRIREMSPVADPATRTYALRIQLDGVEKLPTGLTASVRFIPEQAKEQAKGRAEGQAKDQDKASAPMTSVPLTAIYQQGNDTAVWLVGNDLTVSLHKVTVARFSNDYALVGVGLTGGELVVTAGVNSLVDGQKVRPVDAAGNEIAR